MRGLKDYNKYMKFKVYSTVDTDTVKKAVLKTQEYFGNTITLSEINYIKSMERKSIFYEIIDILISMLTKKMKVIKTDYVSSLEHDGYDGVVLFVDKSDAKETINLYGLHSEKNGKSYIQVYDTKKYVAITKRSDKYGEEYGINKAKSTNEATTHILIHELFHALSSFYKIADLLHVFISEGLFDPYLKYLQVNIRSQMETNAYKLYKMAVSCLKTDVTPRDEYPDELSCAITVNTIHQKAFGDQIGGTASTYWMYDSLLKRKDFQRVDTPQPGDIIISPTGYAGNGGTIKNGHVGIVGDGVIYSNDSNTGLLSANYTIEKWKNYYGVKGKFPIYYFRKK